MIPYREPPPLRPIEEEDLWDLLDRSILRWMSDPELAVREATWVWRDSRKLGFPDVERAADAFLVCMAPALPRF